jgi:3-hydroxy-9,10-secoandrosta-1,3,5(10)-triene-9,17-dione monooxygenase
VNHEHTLAWAAGMVEPLRARASDTESLRKLPEGTINDALDADLFKMLVPEHLGGHGLDLRTIAQTTRTLAHGCMSSAWTLSFLVLHNWFVARGPRELQEAVFADRSFALIPCPLAPTGTGVPTDGGYVLTGRWQWATGVQHGDWVMVNSMVERDGEAPEGRFCLLRIDEVEVIDTWHTSGMRGTGSNDVVVDGVFVPEAQTIAAADLRGDHPPGALLCDDPFVAFPFTPVLTLVAAAPALGGAEAAVDHYREYIKNRVLPYSPGDRQVEQQASQIRLAEALATVHAARLVWEDAIEQVTATYRSGGSISRNKRGRLRLATAYTVRQSLHAVSIIVEGAGASVHFTDSDIGRIHRDLVTLKGHVVYDWDRAAQLAGKIEAGIEPLVTDML